MRRQLWLYLLAFGLVLSGTQISCGGGSTSISPPPAITVSVSPTNPTVSAATIQTFTATVNNDSTSEGVTWDLSCSSVLCGWILPASTASGTVMTYIAPSIPPPSSPIVKVTATSVADPNKSASTNITMV